jgi:hypothetical protein
MVYWPSQTKSAQPGRVNPTWPPSLSPLSSLTHTHAPPTAPATPPARWRCAAAALPRPVAGQPCRCCLPEPLPTLVLHRCSAPPRPSARPVNPISPSPAYTTPASAALWYCTDVAAPAGSLPPQHQASPLACPRLTLADEARVWRRLQDAPAAVMAHWWWCWYETAFRPRRRRDGVADATPRRHPHILSHCELKLLLISLYGYGLVVMFLCVI